ncbi:hypothetical protein [Marinifilum fragile]
MIDKPQILTLNLPEKTNSLLKENNYNVYAGSLGKLVDTNNQKYTHKYCSLNFDFPPNIHEFDIVIVDLSNEEHIPYREEDHIRKANKSKNNSYLLSEHPQTIFDPRGLSAHFLSDKLSDLIKREAIIIVLQDENVSFTYEFVEENGIHPKRNGQEEYSIYSFMPFFPFAQNKYGKETNVVLKSSEFKSFLEKYNNDFSYETTYNHPKIWKNEERIPNPSFFPLVCNKDDEIVSFAYLEDDYGLYLFPYLKENSQFVLNFIQSIAPTIHPKLFPFSTEKKWTNNKEYSLPNHQDLLTEKEVIKEELSSRIEQKDIEIEANIKKYQFLHEILSESGDELVKAVIKFLEWIGFDDVKDVDEDKEEIKEEDIQIETEKGLLIIEVKGIGGTSKDSECSQISKIKYRRAKERGKFDVFGLYLVNHQRHIPPLDRQNPPFSKEQIQDALNDERGLLTTWQLFKLYFDVQDNIISKEEAKECLYDFGLISFKPANLIEVDIVKETFLDGYVSIINVEGTTLKKGDELYVYKNDSYNLVKVLEIKVDNKAVDSVSNGEVGIKTDKKINKNSKILIKNLP